MLKASHISSCFRLLVTIAFVFVFKVSTAQDYHFSQFYNNPTGLNPALTGAFDGVVRASVTGRTQWLSVTKPFLTVAAGVDGAVYKNGRRQELLALGLNFNGDKAGDMGYSSVQAVASLSYIKNIGHHGRHKIGIGLYGGIVNNNLDPASGTWDNQYSGGIYVPGSPSGETFEITHRLYPDFGAGAFWGFVPSKTTLFRVSVGVAHINRPFYGFSESNARLPVRYNVHFYSQIGVSREVSIYPMIYLSLQRKFSEYLIGCNAEYFKKKNSYTTLYTLGGGLFYRIKDAIVLNGFVSFQNIRFSIGYDINVSSFVQATHGRGGVELSLSYIFKRKTITRIGKEPCPYDIM